MSTSKKVLVGIGVVLVLGMLGRFLPKPKTDTPAPPQKTETLIMPIQAKIGDVVNVGNFIYRVDDLTLRKSIGEGAFKQAADGVFLVIALSIKNISDETRILDGSLFKLVNSQGQTFSHSSSGQTAIQFTFPKKAIFLKQCQPGIETSGYLVFEIPIAKDSYNLKVSGGMWSGKTADIALTK